MDKDKYADELAVQREPTKDDAAEIAALLLNPAVKRAFGWLFQEIQGQQVVLNNVDFTDPASPLKASGIQGRIKGMQRSLAVFFEVIDLATTEDENEGSDDNG